METRRARVMTVGVSAVRARDEPKLPTNRAPQLLDGVQHVPSMEVVQRHTVCASGAGRTHAVINQCDGQC